MLVVVSPAKKLDMQADARVAPSQPRFDTQTDALVNVAKKLSTKDLKKLMGISENLAQLNAERFSNFGRMDEKPAVLAFAGDTYQGLDAKSLEPEEFTWAQDHLRILSGLYGLLRPCDAIQPYRLEMGSRLKTKAGATLYDFWGDQISKMLKDDAKSVSADTLINCASQEYFGAVDQAALGLKVITPVFMEERNGNAKIVSFFAKKARGAMARFVIQNRLTNAAALKGFDQGGYGFRADLSSDDRYVFVRDYPTS